jgi:integrase
MRCGGNWAKFEPVPIWKEIQVKKFKSAPNQMRWYLRSFVDYGREKKWFNDSMLMEVRRIPLLKVNPRRIKMPPPEQTEEWLKMCELENQELGSFIRFLATTGLRKSGGNTLRWEEVDLCNHQLRPTMKGGEEEKFPMIPEAYALLDNRSKEAGRPNSGFIWNFSDRQLKKATRIMKKYAKGLGLGLTYFHALRHHFASVALSQGMSPADVAKMLGHKDGGKLICEVYGHVIDTDLKSKAENMRIFGKAESKSNNAENPNTRS